MHPTPELVAAVLRDRERDVERARLARIADCVRTCLLAVDPDPRPPSAAPAARDLLRSQP